MTCSRCQTINPAGSSACASCGAPLMPDAPYAPPQPAGYPPQYPPGYMMPPSGFMPPPQPTTSGMAIAGFVLSFLGCLWIPTILALIFSLIGMSQINKSNGQIKGKGFAIAGLVIALVHIAFYIVYFILVARGDIDINSNNDDWD
jgi:hypothetical protein